MADFEKESVLDIPILSQESHERWFRKMKIRLRARGVIYVIEQSLEDFAPISDPMGENVDEITTKVGDLKIDGQSRTPIRLNIDKKRQYLKDDATAVSILMTRLNEDDESLIDEYPTAKSFWDHISSKYSRTSPMTANENLTAIQTFNFNEYGSIVLAWDKLKEFRRKLGVANPDMRSAYNDVALFLVLSRSLPDEYTSTIDSLDVQSVLTVDEKLKHLEMKELRLKASSEHAHASFKQKVKNLFLSSTEKIIRLRPMVLSLVLRDVSCVVKKNIGSVGVRIYFQHRNLSGQKKIRK